MSVLQNDSNLLQKRDNSKILPAIIVALVLVIACMYPIPVICAALVGYFVWRFAEKTRLERENAARCAGMKYIIGPHLVPSIDPMEAIVEFALTELLPVPEVQDPVTKLPFTYIFMDEADPKV